MFFWDWYSGTVREDRVTYDLEGFVEEVAQGLGGVSESMGSGKQGYTHADRIRVNGDNAAMVFHGGRNRWPYVQGSGVHTGAVCELLRKGYRHEVTRVDSSIDYCQAGVLEELRGIASGIADEKRLKVTRIESDGRTFYIGSKSSDVRLKIYEKGFERRAQAMTKAEADAISTDWVRVELTVRPQKDARVEAAGWEPEQAWGAAKWSRELLTRIEGLEVPAVKMRTWSPGDDDRALGALLAQYGNVLARAKEREGSWELLGKMIGQRIGQETKNVAALL